MLQALSTLLLVTVLQVLRPLLPSWSKNGLHEPPVDRQELERAKHRLLNAVRVLRVSAEHSPAAHRDSAEQAATKHAAAAEAGPFEGVPVTLMMGSEPSAASLTNGYLHV